MIKSLTSLLIASTLLTAVDAAAAGTSVIRGVTYTVDTLEHYKAGPGMTYSSLVYKSDAGRKFHAYVVTSDNTAEGAPTLRVELGRDSLAKTERISAIAKRKDTSERQYLAGINADFFVTSSFANAMGRPHLVGWPNMGCVIDGMLVCSNGPFDGANRYGHFIIGKKPTDIWCDFPILISSVSKPSGGTVSIQPINWDREDGTIVLYNSGNGKYTHTSAGGKEIQAVLSEGSEWGINTSMRFTVVGEASRKGNMAIPEGGVVLSAGKDVVSQLDSYTPGTEFRVTLRMRLENNKTVTPKTVTMTGGDVILLHNGEVTMTADRWINPRDTRYPRTMAGYSKDRSKVVFCVVDGKNVGGSTGVTYPEGAEMMLSYGCVDAVNFDGGGSSAMYLQKPGIVSIPSDGSERAVGNGLYMTIDTPADNNVTEIRFKDWAKTVEQNGEYTPVFFGYNQYGRLVDMDVKGVTLSCPDALGSITTDGTTLIATGTGTQALTATKGGMTAAIAVTVDDSAGIADITADATEGPVEWYNLCGVRIDPVNAVPGIYIRRQGGKAEKVAL